MPREIKIVSMSFLDLLCCALGGVILLSLLMILSMQQVASEAVKQTYFDCRAVVWVDFDPEVRTRCARGDRPVVRGGKIDRDAIDPDRLRREVGEAEFQLQMLYHPLFGGSTAVKPRELWRGPRALEVHAVEAGRSGPVHVAGLQGAEVVGEVEPFSVDNLCLGPQLDWPGPAAPAGRLYYRFELAVFARRVPHGYYFFVVRARRRPGAAETAADPTARTLQRRTAAWLDLSGSGVAGRLLLQTHPTLPEAVDTDAASDSKTAGRALQAFQKKHPEPGGAPTPDEAAKAQAARKRLNLPDRYGPGWSEAPRGHTQFVLVDEAPLGGPGAADRVYTAFFALRHRRGEAWPFGAGFPIIYPRGERPREPGLAEGNVRWGRMEEYLAPGGGTDDYYPPGLCVTVRHP